MILYLVFQVILMFLGGVFYLFPTVTELPWGTDAYFVTAIGYFNRITDLIPPLSTVLTVFLLYMGFRLGLLSIRFFLGSRTPSHN